MWTLRDLCSGQTTSFTQTHILRQGRKPTNKHESIGSKHLFPINLYSFLLTREFVTRDALNHINKCYKLLYFLVIFSLEFTQPPQ